MRTSAIVPIHNEAAILGLVLDAVARQSTAPDELILVLDACSDDSLRIARQSPAKVVEVDVRNTAAAVAAGISVASHPVLVLFDGNTLVPNDYVARLVQAYLDSRPDLVEWHGGMLLLPRSTLERYGPFSRMGLWTLEYFLRIESAGGRVVHLDGPHHRLKRSPLRRNIRYGLDYADLVHRYRVAPFFQIGTKSGLIPDLFATFGTILGHLRRRQFRAALRRLPAAIRSR